MRDIIYVSLSIAVLCVGYSNGCMSLLDVEDGHCLHELSVGERITALLWTEQVQEETDSTRYADQQDHWLRYAQ